MRYIKLVIVSGLLASAIPSFAQQSISLSLKEATEHALTHNRNLKNASIEIQKAEAKRWQTLGTMLPQANLNLDYSNLMGYELDFGGMKIPMNPEGNLTAQVAVALSGAQVIGTQLSKLAIEMAETNQQKSQQQLIYGVRSTYFSILALEETVNLLKQNLANMQKLLEFTENSVKVGVTEQTEADQLIVQIGTMETGINSTKRMVEMLYNSLRLQMGFETQEQIVLTDEIDQLLNFENTLQLTEAEFILENNFDYQLLQKSVDLSKKQITLNAWNYGPTLAAFYQYTTKTYFGKSEGFNMTPPNLIGAKVTIPIFSSGVNYTKVREARLNHETQLNTLADTKNALSIQHSQLKYDLLNAMENYSNQKKNIEVSQRILSNMSKKYEQGMASSLEVTTISTNLISAQNSFVQSLMEVVNAQIALEKLLNQNIENNN